MRRLILGCGKHHQRADGDVTLDVRAFDGVDIVHDLNVVPWPVEDSGFEHISAVHLVEHLASLVAFMDEAHRVLCPGGSLYLETPLAGADPDLEFADPTHVRCYRKHTFANYFSLEGVDRFGYTARAWNFFHLAERDSCIVVHAYPIKS